MPTTYDDVTKGARMSAVVTRIGANGKLKLQDSSGATLVTIPLASVAGTVTGDTLTLSDANGASAGILNTTAGAAGTATKATITTAADVVVISGLTAGVGGGFDVQLDDNVLTVGKPIQVNSGTIRHAA